MALTGIFKNILLIAASVMIWNTKITVIQGVGYSIALAGLVYHCIGGHRVAKGYHVATRRIWGSLHSGLGRRALIVSSGVIGICILLWIYRRLYTV